MGPAAGPLNRVGKSGATPTATVRSKDKACGGCNAEKPGSPRLPHDPANGSSIADGQSERTSCCVTCHSSTMESEVEPTVEWRVQKRALLSARE